ncbi:MAG TPA: inositol monophosphatase family protein, partial [Brevundimonas sp.]|nr:inositol monophosphatase family protein [Brevundimonas sp.]
MSDYAADLALLREAALAAGELALAEREAGLKIEVKPGGSPVTQADLAVDALLKQRLLGARPDYGWLSEETEDNAERLSKRRIFVVDPIDGTVAYMKNKPWWCV